MARSRDLYQVLGVDPGASADEIRSAHRRMVHLLHPDRHYEANDAEQALADRRMREINEAWNTLRQPERRKEYDSTLGLRHRSSNASGSSGRTSPTRSSNPAQRKPTAQGTTSRQSTPGSWTGPGRSAEAGRGAYWHAKDPKSSAKGPARAQPRSEPEHDDDDDEGPAVTPMAAFLLGKGPIIVIVAIVAGLFVVTAYVGGGGDAPEAQPPPLDACARVYDGSDGIVVPCSMPNDGKIRAQVGAPLDCPEEAPRYVSVGTDFYCIRGAEPGAEDN